MDERSGVSRKGLAGQLVLVFAILGLQAMSKPVATADNEAIAQRVSLEGAVILVDPQEVSYIQYGARDLGDYLTEITGKAVTVSSSLDAGGRSKSVIVVGEKLARAMGTDVGTVNDLGDTGFAIWSFEKSGAKIVVVAGRHPQGTNSGIATLMQRIRTEGNSPYLDGPLNVCSKPSFAVRGIHLNGWPLRYPYAFRAWKEQDWKRFVDIAWAQRVNLFYLWPFMEILPVPLSTEDEAYLQEVRRVVDYAQNQRGMEVWIMQSANRIAVSDCGTHDPRFRTYWVNNCQKDMNPADPKQFENILKSFEALYRIVNNPNAFCIIDSDPGGWPDSPLSDQVKIFQAARKLLDRYSVRRTHAKLVNWMWIGWGRHWGKQSQDERIAFMAETIRQFKSSLAEPWELIAGMTPYLESSQKESVLEKTTYLQYGAIEMEPAFPATNLGLEPVREVFDKAAQYPELKGVMGNNELMLLQFPRTYYFFASAWDSNYKKQSEGAVLQELCEQLYPDQKDLMADSFVALRETDPEKISATLARLEKLVQEGNAGRPGAIGRHLFPDQLAVVKNLQSQLGIRAARQSFLTALRGKPDLGECASLVENYFDKLLAWNKETGWDKMIDITIWRTPIYEEGKDLTEAVSRLKQVLSQGSPYTSHAQIDAFFDRISNDLLQKYGQDSVMVGCVEPLKLAVIQGQ